MIKSFNLAKNIIASNFKYLDFPYKLTFILTHKCNSRCKLCNIWKKKPGKEFTFDEITKFFQKSNKFSWVDISGGEIFLRDDLTEIVKAITDNCKNLYLLHFPTNGILPELIEKKTREIAKLKPKKLIVTVSVDGPPELHDELRGIPNNWKKAIDTYRRLKKIKAVEIYIGMTLSPYNFGKFQETYDAVKKEVKDISYKDFHVNIAHSSEHYYGTKLKYESEKEIIDEVRNFMKLKRLPYNPVLFLESIYLKLVRNFILTKNTPLRCKALNSSCFIDPEGNVYPCNSYNKNLGNLRDFDYDIKKIWNLPETKKIRNEISSGKCTQCWTPCEAYQTILGNLFNKKIFKSK